MAEFPVSNACVCSFAGTPCEEFPWWNGLRWDAGQASQGSALVCLFQWRESAVGDSKVLLPVVSPLEASALRVVVGGNSSRNGGSVPIEQYWVDVSDIFNFFCSGEGKGESEAPGGGGGRFFIENSRRGGGSPGRGGGGRGAGRVSARNSGGGSQIFFFGAEIPTKSSIPGGRS